MMADRQLRIGGWLAAIAFAFALLLAVAPQLHERCHSNAAAPNHECAVTLVATGSCDHAVAPPVDVAPHTQWSAAIPNLHPTFVSNWFLSASVFEHAPPTLS